MFDISDLSRFYIEKWWTIGMTWMLSLFLFLLVFRNLYISIVVILLLIIIRDRVPEFYRKLFSVGIIWFVFYFPIYIFDYLNTSNLDMGYFPIFIWLFLFIFSSYFIKVFLSKVLTISNSSKSKS